ncbi:MAG: dipeptide epimerase, partial [Haliscomenobacter sp.]
MELYLYAHELKLSRTFRTSHGARDIQPTLIVGLRDGEHIGLGEATATSYYGLSIGQMVVNLERIRSLIEDTVLDTPETYWEALRPHLLDCPFELCALDMAAHDLYGRKKGLPLYRLWGLETKNNPMTN